MPKPGDLVIMVDGGGYQQFIWLTTEVTIKPLSQVDEAFAWDEGEGGPHARVVARRSSTLFRPASDA